MLVTDKFSNGSSANFDAIVSSWYHPRRQTGLSSSIPAYAASSFLFKLFKK